MRRETGPPPRHSPSRERVRTGERHNTAPGRRKSFVLRGVDTERKGRVSRPLTCSRIEKEFRKDFQVGAGQPDALNEDSAERKRKRDCSRQTARLTAEDGTNGATAQRRRDQLATAANADRLGRRGQV